MTDTFVHPALDTGPAAEVARPANRTLLEACAAELKAKRPHKHVRLMVPERDGYEVEFNCKLDADLIKRWTREATDDDGMPDMFQLALLVVAGQCVAIWRQGERLEISGRPVTFATPELAEIVGAVPGQTTVVVREFYDNDNDVAATHQRIMREAAAGSLDPTPPSAS